jgi:hypothetical protein
MDIVCNALCDKNKLFNNYISIPFGHCLQKKLQIVSMILQVCLIFVGP